MNHLFSYVWKLILDLIFLLWNMKHLNNSNSHHHHMCFRKLPWTTCIYQS
jgi:hypothetical protein